VLPFLHDRLLKLGRLLEGSSTVLGKYNRLDLDLPAALSEFLDKAAAEYRALGRASAENELLALKAQFVSAEHGVDPLTLERVTDHRRVMIRAIALRVLQQSAQRLRSDLDLDAQILADARGQLRPIALLAIRDGLIPPPPGSSISQGQAEELWRTLLNHPEIGVAARQVAMQVSVFDIQLLLVELIADAG
jgi:hypothetical protein